jgi:peptide methionine sulfoxide reductase MsrB
MLSTCGVHLGHNLPDGEGARYCINLVCMAGSHTSDDGDAFAAKVNRTGLTQNSQVDPAV